MEADTTNSGTNNEIKAARLRCPLPGNEVEAATVTTEIEHLLQQVEDARIEVVDRATAPGAPGVFSDALHRRLCILKDRAENAAALMRRLRILCGDTRPSRVERLEDQAAGEYRKRWVIAQLDEATEQEFSAATAAIEAVRCERRKNAELPNGCPRCGGVTIPCDAAGNLEGYRRKTRPAPARVCTTCAAIASNVPPDLGPNVIDFQARRAR